MPIKELLASMAQGVADKLGGEKKQQPGSQDGNVPSPAGLSEAQKKYGPNFEKLKDLRPDLVGALQSLVMERRLADIWAQRRKIRRIRMARDFWQGNQYSSYDGDAYSSPAGLRANMDFDDPDSEETGPRYQFVTNFFQAYGLGFCAVMSQDVPHPEFYPASRERQEDITFSKVVDDVVDEIERNNKPKSLLTNIANRFWTDGTMGGYVRYVVDGERFGYKTLPVQGTQEGNLGGVPMTLPVDQGEEKIPNGQEVITIVGGLELAVPNYGDDFEDCEYLQWNCEPAITKLKAAFPHAADGIEGDSGLSADQVYERIARLGVKQNVPYLVPGDALSILATFSRTWLRKWAFEGISDKGLKKELQELFPDGCYVAFAGLQYCESRNESMADHWRIKNAMPGDGQSRPAVGGALIDVQDRYNVLANIQAETYEYGIPPIYYSASRQNSDAIGNTVSEPAVHIPIQPRPGMAIADDFFQPDPAKEAATLAQTMQELMGPVAQFLCGLFPAIFGGEMQDVKTAKGYQMARDQAMGRLGLIWRAVQEVYFELMFLGVKCFKENRPEDVEVPFAGETDQEKAKWIRKGDLQGNIMLKGEPDADMPRMKGEQRAVLQQLFGLADNPLLQEVFTEPANLGFIKEVFGITELEIPGDDSRVKQMRETQMLLQSGPFQPPPQPTMQPGPDGLPVEGMVQPPPQPTIGVGKYDRHEVELAEGLRYWSSNAGQDEARSNPQGWANFTLHLDMHAQAIAEKAAQQQPKIPPKPPSMSVQIDKLPPGPMAQALAMDNIQADPNELAANKEQQRQDKANELQARLSAKGSGGNVG
jgi:hypothetical protein